MSIQPRYKMFRRKRSGPVIRTQMLSLHWDTEDPFLFVSHHCDDYPQGNAQQAPPLSEIGGRNLGRDYKRIFGFRMYHGKVVPGFPIHAHWGYETITIPEKGFIDHFDSLGNQGRFGFGDVQWISAGSFYQHNEMYPLAYDDRPNPNDITQIMLNLPLKDKGSDPEVNTIWSETIPLYEGNGYIVKIICGEFKSLWAHSPNSVSWAADMNNHIGIFRITAEPGAEIALPAIPQNINRNLYFIEGKNIKIGEETFDSPMRLKLVTDDLKIINGDSTSVFWLLEGKPINEKMSSFGPIVLENDKSVREALNTVRKEELSRWPWGLVDRTQPKGTERFISYHDGREEFPSK